MKQALLTGSLKCDSLDPIMAAHNELNALASGKLASEKEQFWMPTESLNFAKSSFL